MSETRIVDYRTTEIGQQNWEVCARMLVHDLLDEAATNPGLAKILNHYAIQYLPNGAYTMALPRLKVLEMLHKPKFLEKDGAKPTPKRKKKPK